jgi:hypothetical protein
MTLARRSLLITATALPAWAQQAEPVGTVERI